MEVIVMLSVQQVFWYSHLYKIILMNEREKKKQNFNKLLKLLQKAYSI